MAVPSDVVSIVWAVLEENATRHEFAFIEDEAAFVVAKGEVLLFIGVGQEEDDPQWWVRISLRSPLFEPKGVTEELLRLLATSPAGRFPMYLVETERPGVNTVWLDYSLLTIDLPNPEDILVLLLDFMAAADNAIDGLGAGYEGDIPTRRGLRQAFDTTE